MADRFPSPPKRPSFSSGIETMSQELLRVSVQLEAIAAQRAANIAAYRDGERDDDQQLAYAKAQVGQVAEVLAYERIAVPDGVDAEKFRSTLATQLVYDTLNDPAEKDAYEKSGIEDLEGSRDLVASLRDSGIKVLDMMRSSGRPAPSQQPASIPVVTAASGDLSERMQQRAQALLEERKMAEDVAALAGEISEVLTGNQRPILVRGLVTTRLAKFSSTSLSNEQLPEHVGGRLRDVYLQGLAGDMVATTLAGKADPHAEVLAQVRDRSIERISVESFAAAKGLI